MTVVFVVEDQVHSEWKGKFATYAEAFAEVQRLANLPWEGDAAAPCTSWRTCHRIYEILEYDSAQGEPWKHLKRHGHLDVSQAGAVWKDHWSPLTKSG